MVADLGGFGRVGGVDEDFDELLHWFPSDKLVFISDIESFNDHSLLELDFFK